ncbi:MAG: hypothetical protein U9R66_15065 [Thermodesulfobacteriota bacterium]|nr:hypothetical protein [Thermodesulfobacteriota bacterium]
MQPVPYVTHSKSLSDDDYKIIRGHERTGRPLGEDSFIDQLEKLLPV